MNNERVKKYRADLDKKLHESNAFNDFLAKVEQKTNVPRLYLVAGVIGAISLYMIFGYFAQLVCNIVGFLYPAYMSIKAIESHDKADDTQWLTYWVIFAIFSVIEFASDVIVGWFPFYWLVKCLVMLYLHLPMTAGAEKIYTKYIKPFILKHQGTIDRGLAEAAGKAKNLVGEHLNDEFVQKRVN